MGTPQFHVAASRAAATQEGIASHYMDSQQGEATVNGESYSKSALTAAHRTLAFGTQVRVTNKNNGKSTVVRINDRAPFIAGRVIDLSGAAADQISLRQTGLAPVTLEVL